MMFKTEKENIFMIILVFYYKLYPLHHNKILNNVNVDPSPQCIEINRSSLFPRAIISPIMHSFVLFINKFLQPC